MKVKAKDTLHITSVSSDPIRPGDEFTIPDPDARKLLDRGLVSKLSQPRKKAVRKSKNKAAPKPENKSA